jgi:AAA domain-containing protein
MTDIAELARPQLPMPACRVMLVCGPPAAGKSTYVRARAKPDDIVIDFDEIATEYGYNRDRPSWVVGELLEDRNARLANLASEPPERIAWVTLCAPSRALRRWWCEALNVRAEDLVMLVPPPKELYRRVMNDPARRSTRVKNLQLLARWFKLERSNDPGIVRAACDGDGYPTDPLHPWNR